MFMELPPSTRTQMSFTSLTMGLTMRGYRPDFSIKPGWLLWSKVMGTSDHFRYSGGVWDYHDLPSYEFLLPPWLIGVGSTIDVVDPLLSIGEVALWLFRLLILIGLFGHLEHLICETLELVTVPVLVLSLGVENANVIQEAFKFTRSRLVLLVASQSLHIVHRAIHLPLLVVTLGWARLICVAWLFFLLLFSGIEGCLLSQGVSVGDCQHFFWHPRVLHGEHAN
jgi:hypothetical protein